MRAGPGGGQNFTVRRARRHDLPRVADLAAQLALSPNQRGNVAEDGYLVSGYDQATYAAILADAEQFFAVAVDEADGLLGFLVGTSSGAPLATDWLSVTLATLARSALVIAKQVAVAPEARHGGVGRCLYRELIDWAAGRPVLAAIVDDPPNRVSEVFHEDLGFAPWARAVPPDEIPRTVWIRGHISAADLRLILPPE